MPNFADLTGWFEADPRVHLGGGKCRHGISGCEGHACRESLLKGSPYWLRPLPPPEKLPPPFKLPYLGGWKPGQNISSCSIDYLWRGWEAAELHRTAPERKRLKDEANARYEAEYQERLAARRRKRRSYAA